MRERNCVRKILGYLFKQNPAESTGDLPRWDTYTTNHSHFDALQHRKLRSELLSTQKLPHVFPVFVHHFVSDAEDHFYLFFNLIFSTLFDPRGVLKLNKLDAPLKRVMEHFALCKGVFEWPKFLSTDFSHFDLFLFQKVTLLLCNRFCSTSQSGSSSLNRYCERQKAPTCHCVFYLHC